MCHASWLVCLIALLICPVQAQAQTAGDLERQLEAEKAALDSLKARLSVEETQLKQTRQRQQTEAAELSDVERDMFQIQSELRTVQSHERDLARRLGNTNRQLQQAEARMQTREAGMSVRLRDMYKQGRQGSLDVLFSSASFSDAMKRVRYLSRVADQDRRDYDALKAARKRLGDLQALERTQYQQQQALLQSKVQKDRSLQYLAAEKERTLKQLAQNTAQRQRAIRELHEQEARSAQRVAELIQKIQEALRQGQRLAELPAFDFTGHRGRLRRPVAGSVVTRFGRHQDAELKTWTFNRGINIAAPEGANVHAIAPGEVVMVDWFPGYGRFVLLRHPEGFFSLYGHLSSDLVSVGEILPEGTALGTVGSTGRLDGVAQLHFEIMQGEEPLDPILWLAR